MGVPRYTRCAPARAVTQHVIAFFAANPRGTDPLKLGEESADIQRDLKLAPFRDDFRFESRWAVTIDQLVHGLRELDPSVVHLSMHAAAEGVILQDEHGGPEIVPPRALAALIGETARHARVIVLNACSTIAHAPELLANAEAVIAMDGAIGDDAARMFAAMFYGALGSRASIGSAFAQGIGKLAAKRLPDEMFPRCVTRDGVDPREIFLSTTERGAG